MSVLKTLEDLYIGKYINKYNKNGDIMKVVAVDMIKLNVYTAVYFKGIDISGRSSHRRIMMSRDVKPDSWIKVIVKSTEILEEPKIVTTEIYKALTEGEKWSLK